MGRQLLLMRHGKTDWSTGAKDFYRPLKNRGKRDAQRMGVWLSQQELLPDFVIASPAERSRTTAEKICKVMGLGSQAIEWDKRLFMSHLDDLLITLAACPKDAERVLLVGHNPGLEELVLYLAGDSKKLPLDQKLLPTATLACLDMPDNWKKLRSNCASLKHLVHPSTLPRKFPFPDVSSKEMRDRPAYYYRQSAVIPYRIKDGRMQVLVIRSSKNKHWVVPKGIHDPGLSAQDSAAKEAYEEAGVKGKISKKALGSYVYEKWGAECTVTVYPMQVEKLIPEDEWEEKHRGREWLPVAKAAKKVRQQELVPMMLSLQKSLEKK